MLSWMTAKTLKSAAPYIVMAILGALCFWLWNANQKLNRELGSVRVQLEQAVLTNETNQTSINTLETALTSCTEKFDSATLENQLALNILTEEYEKLKMQKDKVRVELKEIFKEPSCNELGQIDINAACSTLASELRMLANGIDKDGS